VVRKLVADHLSGGKAPQIPGEGGVQNLPMQRKCGSAIVKICNAKEGKLEGTLSSIRDKKRTGRTVQRKTCRAALFLTETNRREIKMHSEPELRGQGEGDETHEGSHNCLLYKTLKGKKKKKTKTEAHKRSGREHRCTFWVHRGKLRSVSAKRKQGGDSTNYSKGRR